MFLYHIIKRIVLMGLSLSPAGPGVLPQMCPHMLLLPILLLLLLGSWLQLDNGNVLLGNCLVSISKQLTQLGIVQLFLQWLLSSIWMDTDISAIVDCKQCPALI